MPNNRYSLSFKNASELKVMSESLKTLDFV